MVDRDMPTLRSRRLGSELRRLREEAGLKIQQAADLLECQQPKISQIETGKRGIRPSDLKILLDGYGVKDERFRTRLKQLARDIHKKDWWSQQGPLLHSTLKDYLTLEADSSLVRAYEHQVVPGLLQTPAYATEVIKYGASEDAVARLVEARIKRQERLLADKTFVLRVILDVTVLHRIKDELVEEQLELLLKLARRPNVTLQVLPLDAVVPVDQFPPYTLFSMPGDPPMTVAWLEHQRGGTMLEQRADVDSYDHSWVEMTAASLSPIESQRYIRNLAEKERQ